MTLPPELLQRLADIAPPPAPDWRPLLLAGGVLLALLLLTLAWYLARRPQTPRRAALKRLRLLERQWRQGRCNERETAYRLAAILRLGLGLEQLQAAPEARHEGEWRQFVAQLDELRYQAQPRRRLSSELFNKARRWLAASHA